jgi:hypothetical protein
VLAGGDDGLLRIQEDSLEMALIPNGSADIIGSVRQIIPVGFAHLDLVVTSNGTYSFEGGSRASATPRRSEPKSWTRSSWLQ